jgi:peroxiredoxin
MPLKLEVGDTFPSLSLTSDRGQSVSIAELADGRPLILAFYRGPW